MDWLADSGSVVAAVAASWAAVAATRLVRKTQSQVDIGQRQVDISQRELFASSRPVLAPSGMLSPIVEHEGTRSVDLDQGASVVRLKNIGGGVALNLMMVLFGPQSDNMTLLPRRRSAWLEPPLAAGETRDIELRAGGCNFVGTERIAGELSLLAPPLPSRQDVMLRGAYVIVARLTTTCHDIYGRKHAATWDYDVLNRWICRGYSEDVRDDLDDLESSAIKARAPQG